MVGSHEIVFIRSFFELKFETPPFWPKTKRAGVLYFLRLLCYSLREF